MKDPKEQLRDILDAIASIERYAARGRDALETDELIQVWKVHLQQIIGEAAAQPGLDFNDAHPEAPLAVDSSYAQYPGPRVLWRGS